MPCFYVKLNKLNNNLLFEDTNWNKATGVLMWETSTKIIFVLTLHNYCIITKNRSFQLCLSFLLSFEQSFTQITNYKNSRSAKTSFFYRTKRWWKQRWQNDIVFWVINIHTLSNKECYKKFLTRICTTKYSTKYLLIHCLMFVLVYISWSCLPIMLWNQTLKII